MELKCVLVLALVPIVTAYPHGYGVKGGAGTAAKAEAAAGASAFAGVPLAIPSGVGYSGSFAKSSSSSFAASSASSSASSFSFSGSGTQGAGANGLGNGAGTEGCNGNCKSGNNIIPDTSGTGSNNQAYSGAKAAAGAGAVATSGTPNGANGYQAPCSSGDCSDQKTPDCRGSSCDDTTLDSEKCTSGKCQPTPQATATKEKCTSGQCSMSASESAAAESAPSYDTDDIQVNIASESSETLQKSNDQPNKYYKKSSDYEPLQLYPSTPNKPTTYLTTPKEDTPCTSPGCAPISSSPGGVYDKEKPSSYNVPILGPNYAPSTQNTVPCSTGNCKSNQPSSPHTNLPSGPSGSGSICTSGSCQQYPNNQINPGPSGVPSDFKIPSPTGGQTVISSSEAKNPTYAPSNSAFVNTGAAASSNAIGNYGAVKPTITSTDKKLPLYTGGFGGPAGILRPNDFSAPNQVHVSSYKPVQSTTPTASAPCASGNCAARPSKPEGNIPACSNGNCGGPQVPAFTSENPGIQPPSQSSICSSGSCGVSPGSKPIQQSPPLSFNPPSSTVNFGGPSGILKPNDYSKPSLKPTPTPGSYNPPNFPSVQHDQTNEPSSVQYKPIGNPVCASGNCATRPSKPEANIPACSNGYCGSPNPGIQPPSQSSTCSSGSCGLLPGSKPIQQSPPSTFNPPSSNVNFGGPSGILKPNDYSKPSFKPTPTPGSYNPPNFPSVQHDYTNEPSSIQYKPIGSPVCASGNCAARPSKPEGNIPACSNGNCGGPQFPAFTSENPGIQPPSQSSACSSGSCGVLPGSKPIQQSPPFSFKPPSSTGNFGGPSGILKPNDYSKPSIKPTPTPGNYNPPSFPSVQHDQTNEPSSIQYKPIGAPVCASGNCGSRAPSSDAYSPSGPSKPNTKISSVGFGGPAGILKPNDFNKPFYKPFPTEADSYNPPKLSSSQPNKPNTPQYESAESSASTPCSSGNCGYQPPQPQFGSAVTAQTYPALCGSGKCESQPTQTSKLPTGPYNPAYCAFGNCGTNQIPPFPSTPTNPSSPGLNKPETSGSYHSTSHSSPSLPNYGPSYSPSQTHITTETAASGSFNPSCSSGKCTHEQPSPQYGSSDSKPAPSANTYNPQPCPTGNCGSPNKTPISSTSAGAFSSHCSSGDCGNSVPGYAMPHYNQPGYTNIAVGAVASASAATYTGGFGGPPGLLKPYDGGKLSSLPAGFGPKGPLGAAPYRPAGPSSYGKSLTGTDSSLSGASAQASAVAGAAAGSYGGHLAGYNGQKNGKGGCISGCGSQGGANFGHNGSLDGYGALSAAGASAKSAAGAYGGGGAGVYGQAGSFASSSASAHASAGAATKGGYGRR